MGKTYRGDDKDKMKDMYRQVRDERQNKRHLNDEEDRRQTNDRQSDDEYRSRDKR